MKSLTDVKQDQQTKPANDDKSKTELKARQGKARQGKDQAQCCAKTGRVVAGCHD